MKYVMEKYRSQISSLIIIGLFVMLNARLSAFTISGHVADMVTENNLSQVNVVIISDDYGIRDTVLSNYRGEWTYESDVSDTKPLSIVPQTFTVSQNYPAKGTPLEQSLQSDHKY